MVLTIDHIVNEYGEVRQVKEIHEQLVEAVYCPKPVRIHEIPKPDGKVRPLGIPMIKALVVQMATKMVIEPIFEADFKD